MDDWLVSVCKDNKIVEIYFSKDLREMDAISAIHRGCVFQAVKLSTNDECKKEEDIPSVEKGKNLSKRVRCIETGDVYLSSLDCAEALGIPRWNIYKSIQRGIATRGLHFEYID